MRGAAAPRRTASLHPRSAIRLVLIQIARAVRLTLLDSEVQALKPGEIYEVAPAVGCVLVADGWATEFGAAPSAPRSEALTAADDPSDEISAL